MIKGKLSFVQEKGKKFYPKIINKYTLKFLYKSIIEEGKNFFFIQRAKIFEMGPKNFQTKLFFFIYIS